MKGTSGVSVTGAFVKRTWDISKQNPNGGSGLNFVFNWNAGDVNSPMASPGLLVKNHCLPLLSQIAE